MQVLTVSIVWGSVWGCVGEGRSISSWLAARSLAHGVGPKAVLPTESVCGSCVCNGADGVVGESEPLIWT
jgi:hypothetical protein